LASFRPSSLRHPDRSASLSACARQGAAGRCWRILVRIRFTLRTRSWLSSLNRAAPRPPQGVVVSHAKICRIIDHLHYWLAPARRRVPCTLRRFFTSCFSIHIRGRRRSAPPRSRSRNPPANFCETVTRARQRTRAGADADQSAYPRAELKQFDVSSLENVGYGCFSEGPRVVHPRAKSLPHVKLVSWVRSYRKRLSDRPCTNMSTPVTAHVRRRRLSRNRPASPWTILAGGRSRQPATCWRAVPMSCAATGTLGVAAVRSKTDVPSEMSGYRDAEGYFYILDRSKT